MWRSGIVADVVSVGHPQGSRPDVLMQRSQWNGHAQANKKHTITTRKFTIRQR